MKKIILLVLTLCIFFMGACAPRTTVEEVTGDSTDDIGTVSSEQGTGQGDEKAEIVLYYPDNQGIALHTETREVAGSDSKNPAFVLAELIAGTQSSDYSNVIPGEVVINSCSVEDGICTVDLSREFIEIQGTATQEMAMYSVVNTLCELDSVQEVQFLIDGEKVPLFGYYDFASPFEADMSFVQD